MRQRLFRFQEIERARARLEWDGFPRLQMTFLVMLTGLAGFLASYCLLQWGVGQMWLRYLEATAIAYLVFLFLLWLWLRTSASDYVDAPDISGLLPRNGSGSAEPLSYAGGGGQFDGGGASGNFVGSFDSASTCDALLPSGSPVGDALDAAAQAEEFSIPLIVLVLIGAACLSSFFVIYSAPVLFAELLVDGVLAASLYKRMRGLESRHWLSTAVQRTFLPFALTGLFAAAAGWAMAL
ncbi:MAG: hypothetical protein ACO1NO_01125 [Burkholderiaceae bacterium]